MFLIAIYTAIFWLLAPRNEILIYYNNSNQKRIVTKVLIKYSNLLIERISQALKTALKIIHHSSAVMKISLQRKIWKNRRKGFFVMRMFWEKKQKNEKASFYGDRFFFFINFKRTSKYFSRYRLAGFWAQNQMLFFSWTEILRNFCFSELKFHFKIKNPSNFDFIKSFKAIKMKYFLIIFFLKNSSIFLLNY